MEDPTVIMWIIIPAVVAVGVIITYLRMAPRGEAASAEVSPGEPFSLEAAPEDGRVYKLWLSYSLSWPGVRKRGYGLFLDLDVEVNGSTVRSGRLKMGSDAVSAEDRQKILAMGRGRMKLPDDVIFPNQVKCSRGRRGGVSYEKATCAICETGPRPDGSRISVRGTITSTEKTEIHSLRVFLAR